MNKHQWIVAGVGVAAIAAGLVFISKMETAPVSEPGVPVTAAGFQQHGVEIREAIGEENAKISAAELRRVRVKAQTPRSVSYRLVSQEFNGPISQLDDFYQQLVKEIKDQKVDIERSAAAVAVVYSNPEGQASVKIEVGLPVKGKIKVHEPLAVRKVSLPSAVAVVHTGPYGQITNLHHEILKARSMDTSDAGFPTVLRLITDPRTASSPAELKTEVFVSVEKR